MSLICSMLLAIIFVSHKQISMSFTLILLQLLQRHESLITYYPIARIYHEAIAHIQIPGCQRIKGQLGGIFQGPGLVLNNYDVSIFIFHFNLVFFFLHNKYERIIYI